MTREHQASRLLDASTSPRDWMSILYCASSTAAAAAAAAAAAEEAIAGSTSAADNASYSTHCSCCAFCMERNPSEAPPIAWSSEWEIASARGHALKAG